MTYAFAAAGTGGHVYPALAVADALVADGVDRDRIVFFGGDRMEATTVPAAGYRFIQVPLRGLKRSLSLSNLTIPSVVRRATAQITGALVEHGTSVMTVFGGYVSVPAAVAARRTGAAVFLHEQNADPGIANRFVTTRWGGGAGSPLSWHSRRRPAASGGPRWWGIRCVEISPGSIAPSFGRRPAAATTFLPV